MTKLGCCLGRPRSFDTDQALDRALQVFWEKGYEGASLTDLTKAMGINKPSLYSAFGNKEELFVKVIERYEQHPGSFFYPALDEATVYQMAEKMLVTAAEHFTNKEQPQGCLLIQSALACGEAATSVKEYLIQKRLRIHDKLAERLQRGIDEGDLPANTDREALANYLMTLVQGMSVHATNGASVETLRQMATMALKSFEPDNIPLKTAD